MGLSGFIQDSINRAKENRALKHSARRKFKGTSSENATLEDHKVTKMDFSHLTAEQIRIERDRIAKLAKRTKVTRLLAFIIAILLTFFIFTMIYRAVYPMIPRQTGASLELPDIIFPIVTFN